MAQPVVALTPTPAHTLAGAVPAAAPSAEFTRLRDKARGVFAYNATSLAGHLVGALVIELLFIEVAPRAVRIGWGAVFALVWLVRLMLALRMARVKVTTLARLSLRLRIWSVGVVLSAALWGAAAWMFYGYGAAPHQIVLVLVVYTFCVACIPILAPQFGLYLAFVALAFLPAIARVAVDGGTLNLEIAAVMFVALSMTVVLGRDYRRSFDKLTELKLRTEALMEQLRAEKRVSDAARHEAEVANRAKTQFFTAASHDLRQPLHAMGLFAEALRQRVHQGVNQPEVAQLVNSINESVDALEGLFSELLDITRIDSGGVEVNPTAFEVGDILRKLRLNFEPGAFEKGLALRLRGGRRVVHADPLLVERVLRNLVANAIRYTQDGSVLVAARQRGERVLLQVWDTGPGIGETERGRIFDEFYQVPGGAAASPEQRKGLGLGLAIVKRLAALMQAPLTLHSRPGHGSVFTLELPAGRAPRTAPSAATGRAQSALTLDGRLIVVVEDESAVREGLEVLLMSWGARIESFDSVAAATRWAQASDPGGVEPDLLIVDYRLEDGRTGIDAIAAMRARFGPALPAIVVTGSTMSGHDEEAQAHDFHLLIKPVLPNKLRAMIAFKLASKGGGAGVLPASR
jgi:signal transduction histidine kinase